jgi:hypothetical protein
MILPVDIRRTRPTYLLQAPMRYRRSAQRTQRPAETRRTRPLDKINGNPHSKTRGTSLRKCHAMHHAPWHGANLRGCARSCLIY